MSATCKFEQVFDAERNLQYVNTEVAVLHCHHYATIFTKLALEMGHLNGPGNLFDAMEETAYITLRKYFVVNGLKSSDDRKAIAEQYFALAGLGRLSLNVGTDGGRATMRHSHADEGWLKKYGKSDRSVNVMGQGYLAGAMASVFNEPVGTYDVVETQSLVSGASSSEFTIKRR